MFVVIVIDTNNRRSFTARYNAIVILIFDITKYSVHQKKRGFLFKITTIRLKLGRKADEENQMQMKG